MTLPALLDVCVPSPAFLRLWLLEGKKLSRILRGNQQTLRLIALDLLHAREWCCNENTERWWWKKHVKLFIVLYVGLKSFFFCRKLKLGNGAEVCVQRLMKEEDLGWDFLTAIQIMKRLIKSKEEWNCVLQFEKHWSFFSLEKPEGFIAEGSDWGARREGVLSFWGVLVGCRAGRHPQGPVRCSGLPVRSHSWQPAPG